ncbi:NTP transferase domain-containing protein [Devosia sp. A8/3-2]|nr:NTP transferase domain-containing protein [Devosia sp. A8/3-2]
MTELLSIILAAGEGTRMRSATPKVLHAVGGLSVIGHVLRTSKTLQGQIAVVVGPNHEAVENTVAAIAPAATIARQLERLGTGHAVRQAKAAYEAAMGNIIVLYADTPLVTATTMGEIVQRPDGGADIVVVGFRPNDPTGYGRLLTEGDRVHAIREHRDASEAERLIDLCNSGIMGFRADALRSVIDRIGNSNAKGEYYLTDAVRTCPWRRQARRLCCG